MALAHDELLQRLISCGVVAVIRAESIDGLSDLARALIAGGVTNVELTMTTPRALEGIAQLARTFGDEALIGVGTVLDAATCESAIAAGAEFVVSPHFDPEIVQATRQRNKISIPGGFTATEILRASTGRADIVKVFPSSAVGPAYIRDLLAPLPQLKLIPTGGVDAGNAGEWIRAGAVCVGAGSSLVPKEAVKIGDRETITARAKAFVRAVREARGNS